MFKLEPIAPIIHEGNTGKLRILAIAFTPIVFGILLGAARMAFGTVPTLIGAGVILLVIIIYFGGKFILTVLAAGKK